MTDREKIWPINTVFKTRHKNPRTCRVTNILKTYDAENKLVSVRYVACHEFLGQLVEDRDVCGTTIAMGV